MEKESASGTKLQILSRDEVKYIAMFTMLLNHIAHTLLPFGTPLYEIFEDIGYFTAPVMCYFMVEGYEYTRSKMKYGLRLFLFAVISQVPYTMAFHFGNLNMIYTLFCCFMILVVMEKVQNVWLRAGLCTMLMLVTVIGDWALLAAFFTILFHNSRGNRKKTIFSFGVAYVIFALLNVQSYMYGVQGDWTLCAVGHAMLAGLGIIAAGVAVLVLYNGRRAEKGRNFSKWFFYLFYPAHLLILALIKMYLESAGVM